MELINEPPSFWRDDLDPRPVTVSIHCLAYKHAAYIRQTLEGFVMQQTDFRFEAIVHDDASPDATPDIIREYAERYPSIIKPICETENQYTKPDRALCRIMEGHLRGKYVAFCEGDDFWTDPLKLQKQVDILENDPGVSLVYTAYDIVDNDGRKISLIDYKKNMLRSRSGDIFPFIMLKGCHVQTCTAIMRREALDTYYYNTSPVVMDTAWFLSGSNLGKAVYLKDKTAAYRRAVTGVTSNNMSRVLKASSAAIAHAIDCYLDGKMVQRRGYAKYRVYYAISCQGFLNGQSAQYARRRKALAVLRPVIYVRHVVRKSILALIDQAVLFKRRHFQQV